jgi:hypothetical protein
MHSVFFGKTGVTSVDDEVEMNRVDALAAPTANVLVEDFMEFLCPGAPPAGGPEA